MAKECQVSQSCSATGCSLARQGPNCGVGLGELSRLEPTVRPHAATALTAHRARHISGTHQGNPRPSHVTERKFARPSPASGRYFRRMRGPHRRRAHSSIARSAFTLRTSEFRDYRLSVELGTEPDHLRHRLPVLTAVALDSDGHADHHTPPAQPARRDVVPACRPATQSSRQSRPAPRHQSASGVSARAHPAADWRWGQQRKIN